MDTIKLWGATYTREQVERNLEEAKNTLILLDRKEITPSRVIGTGYNNPRKQAYEYLNRRVGMYTVIASTMDGEITWE